MNRKIQNLFKAIDLAEDYGACTYMSDDKNPCCVIAQLGKIYGVEPGEWAENRGISDPHNKDITDTFPYDFEILRELQDMWDGCSADDYLELDEIKNAMKQKVEDYYSHIL